MAGTRTVSRGVAAIALLLTAIAATGCTVGGPEPSAATSTTSPTPGEGPGSSEAGGLDEGTRLPR